MLIIEFNHLFQRSLSQGLHSTCECVLTCKPGSGCSANLDSNAELSNSSEGVCIIHLKAHIFISWKRLEL